MRGLAVAVVVAAARAGIAVAAPPVLAQPAAPPPPASEDAAEIFGRGRELAQQGRYDEACAMFARSYDLDPALGTAVNLADCLERQGALRRAWELFDRVARESQNVQSRALLARQRADAIAAKLATVIVRLRDPAAAGLAVRIGDRRLVPAPEIRERVEPRDTEVVATVPGRPAQRVPVHVAPGATLTVDIPAFAAAEPTAPEPPRRRAFVYAAAGAAGAGAIGLGASLILGLGARSTYHGAQSHECLPANITDEPGYRACRARVDHAGTQADRATVAAIAGGVLVGAAVALYLAAPRESVPAERREAMRVAPMLTADLIGVGVAGRF